MIQSTRLNPKIIIDTREQNPLKFEDYEEVKTYRDTLSYGDYTLVGHEFPKDDESVIVERKADCKELISNLGQNWDRFLKEIEQLSLYKHKCIIVCGPENFAILYRQGLTQMHPNFVYRQLSILQVDYGIPTIFFENRENAENYMYRYFRRIIKMTNNYE